MVKLVQYTFIAGNNGVSRTFKKVIHTHKVSKAVGKGEKKEMIYQLTVPTVSHQTAISTLVANYFRIEVTVDIGMLATDVPSIYAPLFVLKKIIHPKKPQREESSSQFQVVHF